MPLISIAALRSRLATALADELGTYTYKSAAGSTLSITPALKIEDGSFPLVQGKVWDQRPEVAGLEVVIRPQLESDFQALLGRQYTLDHTTVITLKQWNLSDTVLTAAALLISELRDVLDSIGPRVVRNTSFDSVESQSFTVIHQI